MAEEMRPCPWPECGWAKGEEPVIRGGQANADYYGHAVKCPCCGMRGPVRLTRPEAREAWNSLPRPAAPPEGEGGAQ
ncbi:MAG: hypothetical protein CMH55_07645 [Myxococcales bacterium]|nr:hypothetical protein [Myxococcales bacterium]